MEKNIRVGIGICTCNRVDKLKNLLSTIQKTKCFGDLFVADDGSKDGTIDFLKSTGVEYVTGVQKGVAINKNKIIYRFQDYDFIFIVEDDLIIKSKGWISHYIKTSQLFGLNYMGFCPGSRYGNINVEDKKEDCVIQTRQYDGDLLRVLTKKVVRVCGGYNPLFRGSGWAHDEFLNRVDKAELNGKYKNPVHIKSAESFMVYKISPSTTRIKNQVLQEKLNRQYWEQMKKTDIVYCPFDAF